MMTPTHIAFSLAGTSLLLGTANPVALAIASTSCLLPDIDTSKSLAGRLCFPISRLLEKRLPHRSFTHSFMATLLVAIATFPLAYFNPLYWHAITLGYFLGWFGDVFTKSGVCAFYPSPARLVIPANPRLRLSTGSRSEIFILVLLVTIATAAINISSNGGILNAFNSTLGIPSGAIDTAAADSNQYLVYVQITGRNALTQEPIDQEYEVIKPLTQNDLLVRDNQGQVYRAGVSQEAQILATQMRTRRGAKVSATIKQLSLDSQSVAAALAGLPINRTYLNGSLQVEDADDLQVARDPQFFPSISVQPAQGYAIVRLVSANPMTVYQLLGDRDASGALIVRSIHVQQPQ